MMPTEALPNRLSPLASRLGVRALFGDIHNHCNMSYGHGSLDNALSNAKRQLDFVSVTGHAYWPDMPVDDPSVAHIVDFHVEGFKRLEEIWPSHFDVLRAYHEPGKFTVFPGYEMHSCEHGDYTIVLKSLEVAQMVKETCPSSLRRGLHAVFGDGAFAFPHHIGYRTGARGINWSSFDPQLSPVIELISMHGCSETSLVDRPFLHSMGPSDGLNTVHHGWNLGHIFGVIGNTDHHSGYPGSYGHGRGVVYAPENTSNAVWNGLQERHTNASTGDNAHLIASCDGQIQGGIIEPGRNVRVDIEAVAGSFIDYIDLIKNGSVIERITPALQPNPVDNLHGELDTLLVLELGWGARGSIHDWEGSISVSGGTVDAVEPRLRGAEIVSPLEGDLISDFNDQVFRDGNDITFKMRTFANPNNSTISTKSLAARVRLQPGADFKIDLCGQNLEVSAERLLLGALSGNLGPIDSPAYRLHPLPRSSQWQWSGSVGVGEVKVGDWINLRMRQSNGQATWSSAFFCR